MVHAHVLAGDIGFYIGRTTEGIVASCGGGFFVVYFVGGLLSCQTDR